ncbi:MAG: hypothetical protein WKG32_23890 [Gemmatimonadaceae bacterium]
MRTPGITRAALTIIALGAAVAAVACSDSSSGPRSQPARVELTVPPHFTVPGDQIEGRVFYLRTAAAGGATEQVSLGTGSVTLSDGSQQLTVPVELRDCLRDSRRVTGGATCVVSVALTLRGTGGTALASDTVRQIGLAPNDAYRVSRPVRLERPNGVPVTTFAEPTGDTLTFGVANRPRALDVRALVAGVKRDTVVLTLRFSGPVAPGSLGAATSVFGYIEIDADENAATGARPLMNQYGGTADLGIEYAINLDDFDEVSAFFFSAVPSVAADIPAAFGGDSVVVHLPISLIGDGNFAFGGVLGTLDRATDLFPNSGRNIVHLPTLATTSALTAAPGTPGPFGALPSLRARAAIAAYAARGGRGWEH